MRRLLFSLSLLFALGCGERGQNEADVPAAARVMVSPEPPGENCAAGGQRLDVGVDRDGDGSLSPSEIGETSYICNGEHGVDGEDGADGRDGEDGKEGEDGRTPLVVVTPEPPGENCAAGGNRIEVGFDDDGDGALGEGEIDDTVYVCDGEDGRTALVVATSEAPGPNCPTGGQRIEMGYDEDGDGLLAGEEIGRTVYVCHGEPGEDGRPPLVVPTPEPAGPNCTAGGQRLDMGIDGDRDGTLSEGEIQRTVYVCHGVDGEDGRTPLVMVNPEPAGANCAAGGQRIEIGYDADGDGALGAWEIDRTVHVCHGMAGEDGRTPLLVVDPEPAGANCAAGGQRIALGHDDDGDKTLSGDEIERTVYVCNGLDGAEGAAGRTPIVSTSEEAPGANCAAGGQKVDVGYDDDGDGILAEAEIRQTVYLCNGEDGQDGDDAPPCEIETDLSLPASSLICPDGTKLQWRRGVVSPTVSTGINYSCAVDTNGEVVCWGSDYEGQASPPPRLGVALPFIDVSTFVGHSCALRIDGKVECWGEEGGYRNLPTEMQFKSITVGFKISCGIRVDDDTIHCWGASPALGFHPPGGTFKAVSMGRTLIGDTIGCAVRTDGSITCWGKDSRGEIMNNIPSGNDFEDISVGAGAVCALRTNREAECWGNMHGGPFPSPPGPFRKVEAGWDRACGIREDGTGDCWPQIGSLYLTLPDDLFDVSAPNPRYACGISQHGELFCVGLPAPEHEPPDFF